MMYFYLTRGLLLRLNTSDNISVRFEASYEQSIHIISHLNHTHCSGVLCVSGYVSISFPHTDQSIDFSCKVCSLENNQ